MTRAGLLRVLDVDRIRDAIRFQETRSSAELRVSVVGLFWGNPRRMAERAFQRLGLDRTREHNGVLILLAPWRRRVVVFCDQTVSRVLSESFWAEVTAAAAAGIKAGRATLAVVEAIERIGTELAAHFPVSPDGNPNEVPDEVEV